MTPPLSANMAHGIGERGQFDRWVAILCAGLLGWFVGKALNVPVWRWHDIGDRTDMAMVAALLVFCLTRPPRRLTIP